MITYVKGDATKPIREPDRDNLVVHVVNNIGVWGAGFTRSINQQFGPWPERTYRACCNRYQPDELLGRITFSLSIVGAPIIVNLFAQDGIRGLGNPHPLSYKHLKICLQHLAEEMTRLGTTRLHMPRIGCGLAGGSWDKVEALLNECLPAADIYVYDLE